MMIELKGATLNLRSGQTDILSHEARECPRCHRMTYFFKNINAQTFCTDCQRTGDK